MIWSLNGNAVGVIHRLLFHLGNGQLQNTVLILGMDLFRLHVTHIEAPGAGAAVTLLADIASLLILLLLVEALDALTVR